MIQYIHETLFEDFFFFFTHLTTSIKYEMFALIIMKHKQTYVVALVFTR